MKFLYEIFPILLFFLAFKFYDIYVATYVGIISSFIQVLLTRFIKKKWEHLQIFTCLTFIITGSLTLYFHNPIFIKWKPSIIFWTLALIILITHLILKKSLLQLIVNALSTSSQDVPQHVWNNLNLVWILFLFFLGVLNLIIAYFCSTNTWVNFKFFGIGPGFIIMSICQNIYIKKCSGKN